MPFSFCRRCGNDFGSCPCPARLDAGELAYVERLLSVGFDEVYAQEVRTFNAQRATERGAA